MLFGDGYIIAVMVNVVYIAVIFYALYYIGIKIFDRKTAILSVLILSLYPLFFRYSRFFSIDFALLAMVCLSICLLLYADDFQDRKNSILFGVSLGLGMLTKWSFIFFLFGPLLYSAYRIYLSKKNRRPLSSKKAARNFLLSLLLGACITAVWYLPALQVFIARLKTFIYVFVHNKPSMDSGEAVFGINNISQGFAALINEELSFLFFLVLCFAVFTYRKMIKEQKIVILWFIIPFCIFSLYFTKESRYMLPALPALALLSAAGLQAISKRYWRRIFIFSVIFLGVVQFFDISFDEHRRRESCYIATPIGKVHFLYFAQDKHHSWSGGAPFVQDFKMDEVALAIARYYQNPPLRSVVFCADAYMQEIFCYPSVLEYYLAKNVDLTGIYMPFIVFHAIEDFLEFIKDPQGINNVIFISKAGPWPEYEGYIKEYFTRSFLWLDKSKKAFSSILPGLLLKDDFKDGGGYIRDFLKEKDKFILARTIELPDSYRAYIYFKKPFAALGSELIFLNKKITFSLSPKPCAIHSLDTEFTYGNNSYNFGAATWKADQSSDGKLRLEGAWGSLPGLKQVIILELLNAGRTLSAQMWFEYENNIDMHKLKMARVKFIAGHEYYRWSDMSGQGRFKKTDKGGIIFKDPTATFLALENKNRSQPRALITLEEPLGSAMQVQYTLRDRKLIFTSPVKYSEDHKSAKIKLSVVMARSDKELKEIMDRQKTKFLETRRSLAPRYSIEKGKTRLFFDFGQGRIYYNNRELTSGLGLYTALLVQGLWRDSQNALWDISRTDSSTILARGESLDLPVAQIWQVKLVSENLIEFNVAIEAYQGLQIEGAQESMMADAGYRVKDKVLLRKKSTTCMPRGIRFVISAPESSCKKFKAFKADFLNIGSPVIGYYQDRAYLKKGMHSNFLKGKIYIENE